MLFVDRQSDLKQFRSFSDFIFVGFGGGFFNIHAHHYVIASLSRVATLR